MPDSEAFLQLPTDGREADPHPQPDCEATPQPPPESKANLHLPREGEVIRQRAPERKANPHPPAPESKANPQPPPEREASLHLPRAAATGRSRLSPSVLASRLSPSALASRLSPTALATRRLYLAGPQTPLYLTTLLLVLLLPFEAVPPIVSTSWLALTSEKIALLFVVGAWLLGGARAWPTLREWRALMPSLTLLSVALLAALFAGEYVGDSVRFVARLATAVFVFLVILRLTSNAHRQISGFLWAIVLGAGASAVLGFGEALGWRALDPILGLFKVAPTRVGGELRVSASFQYATIAAMYFEMAAPIALVLAATTRRRWLRILAGAIAAACTANVVLSLTRAGMLTLLVVFGVLLLLAWRRTDLRKLWLPTLASTAVLIGGVAILARGSPVFDMRLVTESDADWYGAAYVAPGTLSLQANRTTTVDLDVRNEGRLVWSSAGTRPFALGYRWLSGDGTQVLDVPPGEVALPRDVSPGETIHLQTQVSVPSLPNGAYRLDWGMLQRDVLQFYERGWANAETLVTVVGAPTGATITSSPRDDGEAPWVVGRLELWGAALALIQERPLLGVGPDNFRHLYGARLGLETWDERVQANNLYLELLADIGLLGFAAFGWMIVPPLVKTTKATVRQAEPYWLVGIGLGILAFLVHGVLDSFLAFTPTAMLVWVLLGILVARTQKPHVSGR